MKNLTLLSVIIFAFAFTGCQEDAAEVEMDELVGAETLVSLDLDSEASIESSFDDIDQLTEAGMDLLDIDLKANGRSDFQMRRRDRKDRAFDCAEITKDTVNQTITIDFGDGCAGPHGVIRKGKIIITYSGDRKTVGSFRESTLEDFFIDSLQVEGTRKTELLAFDTTMRQVRVTMTGGKVTFPDATVATRDADHTKTMVRGEEEGEDYSTVSGGGSGVKRDGTAYSVTILEDLLFKRSCRMQRIVIPVAGTKEVVNGETTAILNYGDGECDNDVEVTVDGETTVKTIEPKGRRRFNKG